MHYDRIATIVAGLALALGPLTAGCSEGQSGGVAAAPASTEASVPQERDDADLALAAEAAVAPAAPEQAVREAAEVTAAPEPAFAEPVAPEDGVVLRTVHGETEEPLPGTVVGYLSQENLDVDEEVVQAALFELKDLEAVVMRFGQKYRTDKRGEVVVPRAEGDVFVFARNKGLVHMEELSSRDLGDELVLRLEAERVLRIEVVDAGGEPAPGVAVSLRRRTFDLWPSVTDESGVAVMRSLDQLLEELGDEDDEFFVAASIPLADGEQVEVPLDIDKLDEPVRLQLPPTGSVRLTIVDAEGEPVEGTLLVGLESVGSEIRSRGIIGMATGVHDEDGTFLFGYVGLGLRLKATGGVVETRTELEAEFDGPLVAGQAVEHRVVVQPPTAVISGTALLPDGSPLAKERVRAHLEVSFAEGGSHGTGSRVRTAEDGSFEVQFSDDVRESMAGPANVEFELEHRPGRDEPALFARVDVSFWTGAGPVDLGEIVLELPDLVLAGVVVDGAGEPVKGASISVEQKEYFGSEDHLDENGERHHWWTTVWDVEAVSDEQGRFEVRSEIEPGELRVLARHEEFFSREPIPARRGDRGLRLVVERGGVVRARILVDEGVPLDELEVRLETHNEGTSGVHAAHVDDGLYTWRPVPTGTATFEIACPADEVPLVRFEDISVAVGDESRDPRLEEVDLRGRLTYFTLEIVDESGDSIDDVDVLVYGPDDSDDFEWISSWGERVEVLTARSSVDLHVSAEGYRSMRIMGASEDQRIVMQSGPLVRLVMSGAEAPEPPLFLRASLQPASDVGHSTHWDSADGQFDERGEAALRAQGVGECKVQISLMRKTQGGSHSVELPGGVTKTVEVLDIPGEQVFHISVDPEDVKQALDWLTD